MRVIQVVSTRLVRLTGVQAELPANRSLSAFRVRWRQGKPHPGRHPEDTEMLSIPLPKASRAKGR